MNTMVKIWFVLLLLTSVVGLVYWLVLIPKQSNPQPALQARTDFDFKTSLLVHRDTSLPKTLLLRRLAGSLWQTSGEHTDYAIQNRVEPSMSVSHIRPDAYLKKSAEAPNSIIIGRYNDRGSGMHGWHVTMVRQGASPISFDRHQRYYVWIEKDFPVGFNGLGEPLVNNPKRWFFAGLADIISEAHYQGYFEPGEGDK